MYSWQETSDGKFEIARDLRRGVTDTTITDGYHSLL